MTTTALLSLSDVQFRWPGRAGFGLTVPELSLESGESLLVLGQSGTGKSTLLSLICGTVQATSGRIELSGQDIVPMSQAGRDAIRADTIGVIFQQFNLLPFASVQDNILLSLHFSPARRARVADPAGEAARLCDALDLPKGILAQKAGRLSVGQQQRVAAARALIGSPALLIADEPTSALDADTQLRFLDLLFAQAKASNAALVMVSHDARLKTRFDRAVDLREIAVIQSEAA
ncbi:MAG: ATP-binding cassette domain-containing protein [Pseudomonadota bacterium]